MANYIYQRPVALQVLNNSLTGKKALLAGTPGSGKTAISHIIINEYIKKYPDARVLVLTHGQNLLKDQYIESLENPHTDIDFTFGGFTSDSQVHVGIPQGIHHLDWTKVDLLVVDECHEFYLKKMVQNIIKDLKPTHQVLMTGSPSVFNYLNKQEEEYLITYISGEALVDYNVFSAVDLDVVKVDYKKNAKECIKEMIEHAIKDGQNISKIMITVLNIREARNVAYYLRGIGRKVGLSTCENDENSEQVKDFKLGKHDTLVVVQRAILGFSDNNITGVFDIRCSTDVDISNQLFARVLRKHPKGVKKFYYRCGTEGKDFTKQARMLHIVKAMLNKDIFECYDGYNLEVEGI